MKKPTSKRAKIFMSVWSVLTLCIVCFSTTAFATGGDPITVVNNLSDFIFSAIKAIGIIILGWGIVQVGAHSVQNQKVKVGSYMGLNMGQVTAITPEAIQLDEYVQEKPGCYKKKSTKIELNVADKRN